MSSLYILNTPIILNINRPITFFINSNVINLIQKNYLLDEILEILFSASANFLYDVNVNKLYSDQFINLRFTNIQDRDYILYFLGYSNYLESIRNDTNISIKGYAMYGINILFNNIVKLVINNVESHFIETGAFSYNSIIKLITKQNSILSYKFLNIYTNQELMSINNVLASL